MKQELLFHAYTLEEPHHEVNLRIGETVAFIDETTDDDKKAWGVITAIIETESTPLIEIKTFTMIDNQRVFGPIRHKDFMKLLTEATEFAKVKNRTHTLMFRKEVNGEDPVLYMSYAKSLPGVDTFCRKEGKSKAEYRMDKLLKRRDSKWKHREIIPVTLRELGAALPRDIVPTLSDYIRKAREFFKITNKTSIIFRSDKRLNRICSLELS